MRILKQTGCLQILVEFEFHLKVMLEDFHLKVMLESAVI